jgi:hypothetical protein
MEASAPAKGEMNMMNTSVNQGSAKIYQFPAGGRAAFTGRHDSETKTVADAPPIADCSGSWYHAAAIQDANNERDH